MSFLSKLFLADKSRSEDELNGDYIHEIKKHEQFIFSYLRKNKVSPCQSLAICLELAGLTITTMDNMGLFPKEKSLEMLNEMIAIYDANSKEQQE